MTVSAQEYLTDRQRRITQLLEGLRRDLEHLPWISVDAHGKLRLAALQADTPAEVKAIRPRVYRELPRIPLAELLLDVDATTGCFDYCTHLSTGEVPRGERRLMVIAATMGPGMNFGLGTMAASTPFSYRQLAWAADWHPREETLGKVQAALDTFVLHHPQAAAWGDGTRASCDGLRVKIGVRAAHADRNAAHFGPDRGTTIYMHTADVGPPFAQKVISTHDREAQHVLALRPLLGFRFAPRIADLLEQCLYTIGRPGNYGPFNALLKGRGNTRVIARNWDLVGRVAASIRHGTASAALNWPSPMLTTRRAKPWKTGSIGSIVATSSSRLRMPGGKQCRPKDQMRALSISSR